MIGKVNQAKTGQTLQGMRAQTSTYGSTIPRIYGTTVTSPLITWLNGLRQASSGKKTGKKGGPPTYRACVSMLLGHNPIQQVFRVWGNQTNLGVNRVKLTGIGGPSHTISDPDFHTIFAVTANVSYSVTFNDYGSNAPVTMAGVYELPLWNLAMQGPDPVNAHGYRWAPFTCYYLPKNPTISQLYGGFTYNVYYAQYQTSGWGAHTAPLQQVLNCAFESSLGDGTEYTGFQNFTAQRIIYPWFAGVGSYNFDLGIGGAPQMRMVVLGSYTWYPDVQDSTTCAADSDFADMVEDIFKMGQTQAAMLSTGVGTATQVSPIQPGLSCFDYPGTVQKKFWANAVQGSFGGTMQYDLPVTKGDILVCAVASSGGSPISATDTQGNVWTAVIGVNGKEFLYTVATASGPNTVTITGAPTTADVMLFQVAGGDTVDSVTVASASGSSLPTGSVTTTNTDGQPAYILAFVIPDLAGSVGSGVYPLWRSCVAAAGQGGNYYGKGPANSYAQQRIVDAPGTYTFKGDVATNSWIVVLMAVKNAVAPSYPKPLRNILEQTSIDLTRAQCRANGLWGSLNMDHQQKAQSWLEDLYVAMNAAPVWSGFSLKSIPRSEVSYAGNGAIYNAPTASGPVVNFTEDDFVASKKGDLIVTDLKATVDRPDLLRMEIVADRGNSYNKSTVPQPDVGGLTLYGLRYGSPKVMGMVSRVNVARMLLGITVRRQNYLVNTYKFTVRANKGQLVEAMDLVTIQDQKVGILALPVRLTSVEESKDGIKCEAEDFVYGLNAPLPLATTENAANNPGLGTTPAAVNTPVFLEPPGALTQNAQDELWIGVSDSDPTYGGCFVYLSVDGGSTYGSSPVAKIVGNAVTGHTTGTWPQATDPDTTNDLPLDLTESLGVLQQYSVQQEDQFLYPCYVAGGGGLYPFELMTYAVANPTGTNLYTLKATGGGNKLRRGVFGTWPSAGLPNTGPAHASNSRFLFLDPTDNGLAKLTVPSAWVGKTLFFKFVQFNSFGGGLADINTVTAYSYTVLGPNNTSGGGTGGSGGGGNVSYTLNPTNPLSQTSPTNIQMAAVTATFSPSGQQTHYNLRNFTIPTPSGPTTYYVTVYDPNLTGDLGAGTTLTAFCQLTQALAHVGQPGYIYMGSITVQASGSAAGGSGGGTNPSGNILLFVPITSQNGDFVYAHGLTTTPLNVEIKNQSDGTIRFQTGKLWDATDVYLNGSDVGLTATLVITI